MTWDRKCTLDILALAGDREVAPIHTRPMSIDPLMNDSLVTKSAMLISRSVWPGRTTTNAPLQQSTDQTVAHLFYNVNQPDCLTTLLAVLLVQGTSLCRHPINMHGVMTTDQSEQRAHTPSKKGADSRMFQFRASDSPTLCINTSSRSEQCLPEFPRNPPRRHRFSDMKGSRSL